MPYSSLHGPLYFRNFAVLAFTCTFSVQFSSVTQSCPTFCDPWTAACQASLSSTNLGSLLKLMSIDSVYILSASNEFMYIIWIGSNFILWTNLSNWCSSICWKPFFFPFFTFIKNNFSSLLWFYFWAFYSVPLTYMSTINANTTWS